MCVCVCVCACVCHRQNNNNVSHFQFHIAEVTAKAVEATFDTRWEYGTSCEVICEFQCSTLRYQYKCFLVAFKAFHNKFIILLCF